VSPCYYWEWWLGSSDATLVTQLLQFVLYFYAGHVNTLPFTEQTLRLGL
jgi:hypothetical protein